MTTSSSGSDTLQGEYGEFVRGLAEEVREELDQNNLKKRDIREWLKSHEHPEAYAGFIQMQSDATTTKIHTSASKTDYAVALLAVDIYDMLSDD